MMDKNRKTLTFTGKVNAQMTAREKVTAGGWITISVDAEAIDIFPPDGIPYHECITLPETFSRGTGVLDSNDRLIYEGDIIRYADPCDYRCYEEAKEHPELFFEDTDPEDFFGYGIVEWLGDDGCPAFNLTPHNFECNGFSCLRAGDYVVEVVGNKWDDPELAEKVMRCGKVGG